jgi:hypothetical protein
MKIKISYFHIDMSSSLVYSEINKDNTNNTNNINNDGNQKRPVKRNTTIKKRHFIDNTIEGQTNSHNVDNMLKLINDSNGYDTLQSADNDDSNLVDFNPPPRPLVETLNSKHSVNQGQDKQNKNGNIDIDQEQPITVTQNKIIESINDMNENTREINKYKRVYPQPIDSYEGFNSNISNSEFNNKFVDYFNQNGYTNLTSHSNNNKDQLLEKLNYMIHLLEEQKDEKTGHVIEEVILYSFLGIFIIFIVDSFARAGKYTR